MIKRREVTVFSISLLDILSGALGAVIILFVAVPKAKIQTDQNATRTPDSIITELKEPIELTPKQSEPTPAVVSQIELDEAKSEAQSSSEKVKELNEKIKFLQEENERLVASVIESKTSSEKDGIPVDVGFNFKGKNILLLIDVSGSMVMEDRIGQVKAGLKMLVTSMGPNFNIDVLHFPSIQDPHRHLWGQLRPMNDGNKTAVYEFLLNLRPYGDTPTREALKYALKNYPNLTDIVLLSDGAPSRGRQIDDIQDILREMRSLNSTRKVQINTIGVGSQFLSKRDNLMYTFLHGLAKEHRGFFYGF
jgi:Mg-chelatase subunit ChlD